MMFPYFPIHIVAAHPSGFRIGEAAAPGLNPQAPLPEVCKSAAGWFMLDLTINKMG